MHHPLDLSLASSYIPACLCLFKCTLAFVLFIFSPVRGWIGLVCALLTDRVLWNQQAAAHSTILDVNAVCVSLVGALMVMHAREEGVRSVMQLGIIAAWALLSALQILGTTKLPSSVEVVAAACCVSILSCLFQTREIGEVMALRSFVFVMANVVLPYLGVLLQNAEVTTYVIVCRTLPILLGGPEIACAWVAVYVLCMGYQVRNSRGKQQLPRYSPEPQQQQQSSSCTSSAACHSGTAAEEASLLREALARKQCREC